MKYTFEVVSLSAAEILVYFPCGRPIVIAPPGGVKRATVLETEQRAKKAVRRDWNILHQDCEGEDELVVAKQPRTLLIYILRQFRRA
jgi:hypothetical protein